MGATNAFNEKVNSVKNQLTGKYEEAPKVAKYYQDNKLESYMEDERVAVREIRVSSRDLADSLLQEIFSGADFSSLAEPLLQSLQ